MQKYIRLIKLPVASHGEFYPKIISPARNTTRWSALYPSGTTKGELLAPLWKPHRLQVPAASRGVLKIIICVISFYCLQSFAATTAKNGHSNDLAARDYVWNVSAFYGRMTDTILNRVLRFKDIQLGQAKLYSLEGAYQLAPDNLLRRFLQPALSTIFVGVNGTYEDDPNGAIYELNPFLMLRWQHFPLDKYIVTTFGFGDGVSFASGIPARETRDIQKAENARKFLNLLLFEVTAALPSHPDWQIIYRIHHRSGVFGLYSPGITGSTAIQVGIRHQFN